MLITAVIAFREFLEAFLLIGIFIGIDRKLQLGKWKEILMAALTGIVLSLLLPLTVFFFAGNATHVLTEKNADVLEGYLLTFSGFFLAYVIFALHKFMENKKKKAIDNVSTNIQQEIFDISLFFTIVLFIIREGFEVAILIAATSLFSTFLSNIEGLFIGFLTSSLIGLLTFFTYLELPIKKIFTYTEALILIIGAAMVKNGISLLLDSYAHIHIEKLLPLPLQFLPTEESIFGHTLSTLTGLQREFSLVQVSLMALYIASVILVVKKAKQVEAEK